MTGDVYNFIDSFCYTDVDVQEAHGSTRQELKIIPNRAISEALSGEIFSRVMIQLFLVKGLKLIRINAVLQFITALTSVNEKQFLKHISIG